VTFSQGMTYHLSFITQSKGDNSNKIKKMLTKSSPISIQSNLFHSELFSQLDVKDPLIQLANTINWTVFDDVIRVALKLQNNTLIREVF
jgi:hypothetical protein